MRLNRTRRQSVCACTRCLRDGGSAASGSWRPRSTQSASPRDQAQSVQPANGDSGFGLALTPAGATAWGLRSPWVRSLSARPRQRARCGEQSRAEGDSGFQPQRELLAR